MAVFLKDKKHKIMESTRNLDMPLQNLNRVQTHSFVNISVKHWNVILWHFPRTLQMNAAIILTGLGSWSCIIWYKKTHVPPTSANGRMSTWRRERRQEEIFKALLKSLIKDSPVWNLPFLALTQLGDDCCLAKKCLFKEMKLFHFHLSLPPILLNYSCL